MKRDLATGILLAYLVITCGCAAAVVGVGAAAGVGGSYLAGKETRTYDAEYARVVQVCQETLSDLKAPVSRTDVKASMTTILARRTDDTPVTIEVVRVGPGRSQVGVRTGRVGVSELEASNEIHDALRERLRIKISEAGQTDASASRAAESAQPPAIPDKRSPGRKTGEASPRTFAKSAPAELTIYFLRDSNELRPDEAAKLDKLAETTLRQPETRLTLNGYTDSVGPDDYNLMIAESRATSVKLYLVAKGVNPLLIAVAGKGARDFVAGNDSEEGRSLNRRVEIKIEK
jgi:outer membrane protein OmpA-like peptidoglycan-associated protein